MDAATSHASTDKLPVAAELSRQRMMLHDGFSFVVLVLCTLLLGVVTTFLFRSFESHRDDLAVRWAGRGRDALDHGRSAEAVTAFRTALSYRPDNADDTLALAEALAADGHVNEAETYFMSLWQARPGDGLINLQLARLQRSRGDATEAVNFYRAAIFGTWNGDAIRRRRDIRLELSEYLVSRGDSQAAVAELLISAANNPDGASQLAIGRALEAAHDPKNAFAAYRRAQGSPADRQVAQAKEGELCYSMGGYACAAEQLGNVLHAQRWTPAQRARMTALQKNADRLRELAFSPGVPVPVRSAHLLYDAQLAEARLKTCTAPGAQLTEDSVTAAQQLQVVWKTLNTAKAHAALRHDDDLQQRYGRWIDETEGTLARTCGPPSGDDALLLYLQEHPMTGFGEPPQ